MAGPPSVFSALQPPPLQHALIIPPMQNRLALPLRRVAEADTGFMAHFHAGNRKPDVEFSEKLQTLRGQQQ